MIRYIVLFIFSIQSAFSNTATNSLLSDLPYRIIPGKTKLAQISAHGVCKKKGVVFGYYITCTNFVLNDGSKVFLNDEETVSRLHLIKIPKAWKKVGFSNKMTFGVFKKLLYQHKVKKFTVVTNDTFYVVKFSLNDLKYEIVFNKQSYYSTGNIMFFEGLHEIYIDEPINLDLDF